jgi:hypothetical protein
MAFSRIKVARIFGGIVTCSLVAAAGATVLSNPYLEIPARNVFGLRPPQPARVRPPPAPLPRIMLTGITTILGVKRALLRIQFPARPFQPAVVKSCILTEGQRDGPVEVLEIKEKTSQVKVDNSGTVSVITFEKASAPAPGVATPRPRPYWPRLPAQAMYR